MCWATEPVTGGGTRTELKRLAAGGGLVYGGIVCLMYAHAPLTLLFAAQTLLLPLYAMGAGRNPGGAPAYLILFGAVCLLLLPGSRGPRGLTALAGYTFCAGALLCTCLLIACRCPNRAALPLCLGFALSLEALEQAAYLLDGRVLGRLLLYVLPAVQLNAFLAGSLDLKVMAGCCAWGAFALWAARRPARPAVLLKGLGLLLAALMLAAALPTAIFRVDVTEAGLTTLSPQMETVLRGLNLPVTVYQAAPLGQEDPWVRLYLKKLAQRHAMVTYKSVSPKENRAFADLELPANSLVVEQDSQWIIVRAEDLYTLQSDLNGTRTLFALEGALLAALDEATGLTMSRVWTPYPKVVETMPERKEGAGIYMGCAGAVLLSGGLLLCLRRKQNAKRNQGFP